MKVYSVREVFTPSQPAKVAFVERESINTKLVNALRTPGKQIVVYGHSGSGKTTLLENKLHQLYESHITTRCMKGVTFDQLILDAFDQLSPFYVSEHGKAKKSEKAAELSTTYLNISAKLGAKSNDENTTKQLRILPPQLTPQNLARLVGASGCCWVLEDFHKINDSEKPRLAQLMKVFMDESATYPELKIVALGAVDTARQVVEFDSEMKNRVSEIKVDLMTPGEILAIIKMGEEALNILFDPAIKNAVANYSSGLASVCHHLCLNICDTANIDQTVLTAAGSQLIPFKVGRQYLSEALKLYVQEASDSIKSSFDKALKTERKNKYDNAKLIILALSHADDNGLARADLLRKIRKTETRYPISNLKLYLEKLQLDDYGSLIRFSPLSNCYSFADPFFRVFAIVYFKESNTSAIPTINIDNLTKALHTFILRWESNSRDVSNRPDK